MPQRLKIYTWTCLSCLALMGAMPAGASTPTVAPRTAHRAAPPFALPAGPPRLSVDGTLTIASDGGALAMVPCDGDLRLLGAANTGGALTLTARLKGAGARVKLTAALASPQARSPRRRCLRALSRAVRRGSVPALAARLQILRAESPLGAPHFVAVYRAQRASAG